VRSKRDILIFSFLATLVAFAFPCELHAGNSRAELVSKFRIKRSEILPLVARDEKIVAQCLAGIEKFGNAPSYLKKQLEIMIYNNSELRLALSSGAVSIPRRSKKRNKGFKKFKSLKNISDRKLKSRIAFIERVEKWRKKWHSSLKGKKYRDQYLKYCSPPKKKPTKAKPAPKPITPQGVIVDPIVIKKEIESKLAVPKTPSCPWVTYDKVGLSEGCDYLENPPKDLEDFAPEEFGRAKKALDRIRQSLNSDLDMKIRLSEAISLEDDILLRIIPKYLNLNENQREKYFKDYNATPKEKYQLDIDRFYIPSSLPSHIKAYFEMMLAEASYYKAELLKEMNERPEKIKRASEAATSFAYMLIKLFLHFCNA